MRKMNFENKLNRRLVIFLTALSIIIMMLAVLPATQSRLDTNVSRPNLLLPTEKNIIRPGNMALADTAAITDSAHYLIHAQADVTSDNAGNGADPGDPDPDDGGWDWMLTAPTFVHSAAASPTNIYGVTALGIYYAYRAAQLNSLTPNASYMIAMTDAANKMIANANIRSAGDLIFLMLYDDLPSVCGTTYQDAARAKYDGRITTYGSATALAQWIRDSRHGSGYDNGIIAWDIGAWAKVAAMLDARYGGPYGADADAIAEVIWQDSFNSNPGYFDIIADQGPFDPLYGNVNLWWYTCGITGLIDAFDAAQVHTGEIPGLLTILSACQYPSGAYSNCYGANTNDEDWQSTAYAVMSLGNFNAYTYQTQIQAACAWLKSTQDPISGGWVYSDNTHYPEVCGECTSALYFAGPVFNIDTGEVFWSIQAAIDDLDTVNGNTIEVQPGTYNGNILIYKEVIIQSSGGNVTTIIDASQIDVCNYKNAWCKGISYTWSQSYDPGLLKNGFDIWANNTTIDGFKVINALWPSQYNRGIGILIGSIATTYAGFNPKNIDQWGGLIWPVYQPKPTGVTIKHNYIDAASDGIYNWASSGNTFEYNTVVNSNAVGGAGIQSYEGGTNNIIRGNTITNCDGAGVSVGGKWDYDPNNGLLDISNTQIYNNVITSCGIGIQFYNANGVGSAAYNNQILSNNIGIYVGDAYGGSSVATAYCNEIVGNTNGVINNAVAGPFIAECNWWGDCSGPSGVGSGTGDSVSNNVDYTPWVGYVVAEANGPYTGDSIGFVHFSSAGSQFSGCCDETIVSYDWNFGDGSPHSNAVNPTHQYTADGTYPVTLTVTVNALGETCSATDSTTAFICLAHVAVDKKVWDGSAWVDNIRVANGTKVKFKITITNTGSCDLNGLTITDYLSTPQLKYRYDAKPAPTSASDNNVVWTVSLTHGQTITIIYNASAVHTCYGWNSVYVKDYIGIVLGYDLTNVKVVDSEGQPALAVSTMVWDDGQSTWSDHATLKINEKLKFKITITSTALTTVHDVTITDLLPALVTYNYDATLTPASASNNEVIWNIGDVSPGDEIEITLTTTTKAMGTDYTTASVISYEGFSDQDYVLLEADAAPSLSLLYPVGGETLQNTVTIQWYAHDIKDGDTLLINVYYRATDDALWTAFSGNPYLNSGTLSWDTTRVPDGNYQVQIVAQDSGNNVVTVTSDQFQIKNTETPSENLAPETPGVPSGTAQGKPGSEYTYATSTVDPDGDQVFYLWDWGDGSNSGWLGPYSSGTIISTTHTWAAKGSYNIKVMAKDIHGKESGWSDPLPIKMPYTFNKPLFQFLESLFARFPNMFPVLRHLLG
ncbi:Cell surface glycoprotein [uncultured archaeon]|nr:Cell surface glycoprotein [uncultured archaeon]